MKNDHIIVSVVFAALATSAAAGRKEGRSLKSTKSPLQTQTAITRESQRGTSGKSSKEFEHIETASEPSHVRFGVSKSSKESSHSESALETSHVRFGVSNHSDSASETSHVHSSLTESYAEQVDFDTVMKAGVTYTESIEFDTGMKVGMEFDCAFANPAERQAEILMKPIGLSFEYLISHAELVNTPYSRALDEWLVNKSDTQGLFDEGEAMGDIHLEVFSVLSDEEKSTQICAMTSALVSQMKNTCNYEQRELALEHVAAALMDGFAFGVGHEHVKCEGTLLK
jgi:hypothetical protein